MRTAAEFRTRDHQNASWTLYQLIEKWIIFKCLQEDNYMKTIAPLEGSSTGFLYFGHTGNII